MKIVVSILLILLLGHVHTHAQEFEISYSPDYIETLYQSSKTYEIVLVNNSNRTKEFQLTLNQKFLLGGSKAEICVDNHCNEESLIVKISPQKPIKTFSLNFTGGLTEISSSLLITVKDLDFNHELTKEINVRVTDFFSSDLLFLGGNNKFNNLFPNPATTYAAMNYACESDNAKIILQNVLGSIIHEYEIDNTKDRLIIDTENLKAGVYFYTLLIDGEGLATKKLVVKK